MRSPPATRRLTPVAAELATAEIRRAPRGAGEIERGDRATPDDTG